MPKQLCPDLEIFAGALDGFQPHPLNVKIYGQEQPDPDLMKSIRKIGLLDPPIVSPLPNRDRYIVVPGSRRFAALHQLHRTVARVRIVENLPDLEIELALIEANRHREKPKNNVAGRLSRQSVFKRN